MKLQIVDLQNHNRNILAVDHKIKIKENFASFILFKFNAIFFFFFKNKFISYIVHIIIVM